MESSNSKISPNRRNGDRLSSLSDTLLQSILCFLDSNYAFKASLLSKRWRDLWVSLPILNFYTNMTHVDNLLLHRDGSDIHSFRLKNYHGNGNEIVDARLYSWILISIRHNIRELDLDITSDYPSSLPISLFTCQSLRILSLKFQGGRHQMLRLPGAIKLPRLKALHLISVCFLDANECNRLISSCPFLQSLILWELELLHPLGVNLNIFVPTLEHLKIETYYDRLDIYAPNLRSLNIKGSLTRCYLLLGDFNYLVNAEMDMDTGDCSYYDDLFEVISAGMKKNFAQDTIQFLQVVSKVKSLALSPWVIMILSETLFGLENLSTQFVNIKHMKLRTYLSLECIHVITRLLEISPGVETLKLEFIKSKHLESPSSLYRYEKMIDSVNSKESSEAGMMLYHLKVVEVRGFVGCENELKMLEIVLKSCVALERLVIFTSKEKPIDIKQRLIKCSEKLVALLRRSSKAPILFF